MTRMLRISADHPKEEIRENPLHPRYPRYPRIHFLSLTKVPDNKDRTLIAYAFA